MLMSKLCLQVNDRNFLLKAFFTFGKKTSLEDKTYFLTLFEGKPALKSSNIDIQ